MWLSGPWLWLIAGLVLMALEFLVPGLVVIFLGMGMVCVAGLQFMGLVESFFPSVALWLISSLAFLLVLRNYARRWFPGEITREYADEDDQAYGQVAEVLERVHSDSAGQDGRIRFQGTTWSARTISGEIHPGRKVRLIYRQDNTWVVEPEEFSVFEDDILSI